MPERLFWEGEKNGLQILDYLFPCSQRRQLLPDMPGFDRRVGQCENTSEGFTGLPDAAKLAQECADDPVVVEIALRRPREWLRHGKRRLWSTPLNHGHRTARRHVGESACCSRASQSCSISAQSVSSRWGARARGQKWRPVSASRLGGLEHGQRLCRSGQRTADRSGLMRA